jgi:hypothetical protein
VTTWDVDLGRLQPALTTLVAAFCYAAFIGRLFNFSMPRAAHHGTYTRLQLRRVTAAPQRPAPALVS